MPNPALKDTLKQIAPLSFADKQATILKANGKREAFEPEKLRASLIASGSSEEMADDVVVRMLSEIRDGMTTTDIYRRSFDLLREMSKPVARSYSLRRAIMDLGPSGFPFEKFIAEILKAKGFETLTGQTLLGGCVPHEVDVVAWNQKKLIVVEAKFHNELGTKSDLKVALYIKARFDDLKDNVYKYGGEDRAITDAWLITNTKFSSTAIHYGACQNLTMIGWNYPENGSLADMIEHERLHPVTCLSSLSADGKKSLLARGVVLCSSIRDNPGVLEGALGSKDVAEEIIAEVNDLYNS